MEIVVTRSRIAGTLPFYEYRALVPVEDVAIERRARTCVVRAPKVAGSVPCLRIAAVIAPDRFFSPNDAGRCRLAAHIGTVAKRIETLIVRNVFPEMTADTLRPVIPVEHDPGDACVWTDIDDLAGSYDRFAPECDLLMAFDFGLRQDFECRAA
ncbi:hypothetical protein [uncultured Sphingomonas sp.]|uniref:hypothetical protein n=1 Tax=uncultured Sphingomonas sp. TaxID=158754 RepID=UPI00262E667B|nr:hypothetical protein [uncultured Sphingomonas sp.]